MSHSDSPERRLHGRSALETADRVRSRAARSGRWFAGYLLVLGLLSAAWITVVETLFSENPARLVAGAVWAIAWIAAGRWTERRSVYPLGASRALWIAFAAWFGLYLFVVGPFVRGTYGDAVAPWTIGSLVAASPFAVAAAWISWRR